MIADIGSIKSSSTTTQLSLLFEIIQGQPSDLEEIQKLFVQTIESVCSQDYADDQIKVWVSSVHNVERWLDIIENQYFIKAVYSGKIIGFASLANHNYVDFLYVHKDYQRLGIARGLLENLEIKAKLNLQTILTSDVSLTARKFFENAGFVVIKKQIIERKNVILANFKMTKGL